MYNFITDMFRKIVEASSIIFDLCQQYFANTKMFKLEMLGSQTPPLKERGRWLETM